MIVFKLRCAREHEFDAWFANSEAFEAQLGAGEVACPECGSADLEKAIMAPRLNPKSEHAGLVAHAGGGHSQRSELRKWARMVKQHVEQNFEFVGDRFPDEARKAHKSGEEKERKIYGSASVRDVKELSEEGIDVLPVPDPDLISDKKIN